MYTRLRLTDDTLGPVGRGHPWVWKGGVEGRAKVGEWVELTDAKGRVVAFGVFDEGAIPVRVLARSARDPGALVTERITRADRLRAGLGLGDTDCYRVVNGEGDQLPGVVIDRYGDLAVLRLYSRAWEPMLDELADAIMGLGWAKTVFRRLGVGLVDGEQGGGVTLRGPETPRSLVVKEHSLRFIVRPYEGQKTGLFLDQREHRRRVGELGRDREVVNLFGYTGGFSVFAAAGGARRVTTVDVAGPALEDAKENFRLNGLDPGQHAFERADAFKWEPSAKPDLLICDPPSLTKEKDDDAGARKAYRDLNGRVAMWVRRDGLFATASCTARLSGARWEEAVREGLRKAGRWAWIERSEAPADHPVAVEHPEGRYLKWALLRRFDGAT